MRIMTNPGTFGLYEHEDTRSGARSGEANTRQAACVRCIDTRQSSHEPRAFGVKTAREVVSGAFEVSLG